MRDRVEDRFAPGELGVLGRLLEPRSAEARGLAQQTLNRRERAVEHRGQRAFDPRPLLDVVLRSHAPLGSEHPKDANTRVRMIGIPREEQLRCPAQHDAARLSIGELSLEKVVLVGDAGIPGALLCARQQSSIEMVDGD